MTGSIRQDLSKIGINAGGCFARKHGIQEVVVASQEMPDLPCPLLERSRSQSETLSPQMAPPAKMIQALQWSRRDHGRKEL